MKKIVRQMGCLVCLLLCGLFYTSAEATEEAVDTEAMGTLTVSYSYGTDADPENNLALAGVSFRLYRIASVSSNGTYALTDDFAGSGLTDEQLNSMEYATDANAVIETLVSWLNKNSPETEHETDAGNQSSILTQTTIAAAQEAATDENGTAVFTNLQTGLYLLVGESLTEGGMLYTNSPSLISIPSLNAAETGWEYAVTVNAKAEAGVVASDPDLEPDTGTDPEPDTEESTETTTEPDTETQTEVTTEPDTETQTEATTEPDTETQTEATTESDTETPAEPQTELPTESQTQTELQTETATESSTEAVTEPQTESETTDSVQTGDDTPLMTWLLLLCGSCMVFAVCGLQRRKTKKI